MVGFSGLRLVCGFGGLLWVLFLVLVFFGYLIFMFCVGLVGDAWETGEG